MRHKHKSSTIDHSEYDQLKRVLTVKFHSGSSYEYHGVPMMVANEFQKAKSSGSFFHSNIRGNYKTVKLEK